MFFSAVSTFLVNFANEWVSVKLFLLYLFSKIVLQYPDPVADLRFRMKKIFEIFFLLLCNFTFRKLSKVGILLEIKIENKCENFLI
jgi:hypothetical protein